MEYTRFEDPIQNFELRVRMRQVAPRRAAAFEERFAWQEKVLGPHEILAFDAARKRAQNAPGALEQAAGAVVGGLASSLASLGRDKATTRRLNAHRGALERLYEQVSSRAVFLRSASPRRRRRPLRFLPSPPPPPPLRRLRASSPSRPHPSRPPPPRSRGRRLSRLISIRRLFLLRDAQGADPKARLLSQLREKGVYLYTYVDRDGYQPPGARRDHEVRACSLSLSRG